MKIIHIADLHIRASRQQEYYQVFDNFIDQVESIHPAFVVIAGDIFDNKITVKPDEIDLFCYLLKSIIDLKQNIHLIIMPGNHDANMNDPKVTDLLTPIIKEVFLDNFIYKDYIHFYSKTGKYQLGYDLIDLYVYSPIDKQLPPQFPPGGIKQAKYRIALVHEPIRGCKLPNGMSYEHETRLSVDDLLKYDAVFMGDIHKKQFLKPHIAYCGSLIQQNISEDPFEHGFLIWDLEKRTVGFAQVENPMGVMLTLFFKDNIIEESQLPNVKVQRIDVKYQNCSPETVHAFSRLIKQKYGVNITNLTDLDNDLILDSPQSIDASTTMLTFNKWLESQTTLTPEQKEAIKRSHTIYGRDLQSIGNSKQYDILYLEWKNLFIYGDDKVNYINFTEFKHNDRIGIMGKNYSGKSSIIDIISFILFNNLIRGDIKDSVNINAKEFSARIIIRHDNDLYVISRTGNRNKHHLKILKNGEEITKATIILSYEFLKSLVGTHQDFKNITCQLQEYQLFTSLSHIEQVTYLYQILGIDQVPVILDALKAKLKEIKQKIDKIKLPSLSRPTTIPELPEHTNDISEEILTLYKKIGTTIYQKPIVPNNQVFQLNEEITEESLLKLKVDAANPKYKMFENDYYTFEQLHSLNIDHQIDQTEKINLLNKNLEDVNLKIKLTTLEFKKENFPYNFKPILLSREIEKLELKPVEYSEKHIEQIINDFKQFKKTKPPFEFENDDKPKKLHDTDDTITNLENEKTELLKNYRQLDSKYSRPTQDISSYTPIKESLNDLLELLANKKCETKLPMINMVLQNIQDKKQKIKQITNEIIIEKLTKLSKPEHLPDDNLQDLLNKLEANIPDDFTYDLQNCNHCKTNHQKTQIIKQKSDINKRINSLKYFQKRDQISTIDDEIAQLEVQLKQLQNSEDECQKLISEIQEKINIAKLQPYVKYQTDKKWNQSIDKEIECIDKKIASIKYFEWLDKATQMLNNINAIKEQSLETLKHNEEVQQHLKSQTFIKLNQELTQLQNKKQLIETELYKLQKYEYSKIRYNLVVVESNINALKYNQQQLYINKLNELKALQQKQKAYISYQTSKQEWDDYDEQYIQLANEKRDIELYCQALNIKTGYPNLLLQYSIKRLHALTQKLVHQVSPDLNIEITNDFHISINKISLGLTSGYQKMIVNIALRCGMLQICQVPSQNLTLWIDEGLLGSCDSTNMHKLIKQLLPILPIKLYMISHHEELKAAMTRYIDVQAKPIAFGKQLNILGAEEHTKDEEHEILENDPLYCATCKKRFKNMQIYIKHEQSALHLKKAGIAIPV
jgi:DNA repair exonuclease SbcCD ATPase subunit/DNA repair exonuclease SbcCD nuclease subunit